MQRTRAATRISGSGVAPLLVAESVRQGLRDGGVRAAVNGGAESAVTGGQQRGGVELDYPGQALLGRQRTRVVDPAAPMAIDEEAAAG